MRRLQVLTPLSLLVNIATLMTCRFILTPNLGERNRQDSSSKV